MLLYVDKTLSGQSSNRYFYAVRTADTNGLQSMLSVATPPVEIPKTTPPPAPVITAVLGGENQVIVKWAKNPGAKIAGYLLYRTQELKNLADWRKMELVKPNQTDLFTVAVNGTLPGKEFEFMDSSVVARQAYYYALVGIGLSDEGKWLRSRLSKAKIGQAYDQTPPEPPVWDEVSSGWVYVDDDGTVYEWNADISGAVNPVPAIRLVWLDDARVDAVLIARNSSLSTITAVIANWIYGEEGITGKRFFLDTAAIPGVTYTYSGTSKSAADLKSINQTVIVIPPNT